MIISQSPAPPSITPLIFSSFFNITCLPPPIPTHAKYSIFLNYEKLQGEMASQALVIGISGPSSSGKTTLARLLQRIFSPTLSKTFIIHEDDFYVPDDKYFSLTPFQLPYK